MPETEDNEFPPYVGTLTALITMLLMVWWLYALSRIQCERMFTSPDRPWRPAKDSDPGQQQDQPTENLDDAEIENLKKEQ